MDTARTILITLAGLAIAGVAAVFTASMLVALLGVGSVLLAARAISLKMQPEPIPARARRQGGHSQVQRVWDDGRGKIIDM